MIDRIALILEDLFGIDSSKVEIYDDLRDDWGLDDEELLRFNVQYCAEFGVEAPPHDAQTIGDYIRCIE